MKKWLIVLVTILLAGSTAYGYLVSDYNWVDYNGHQYAITLGVSNWTQSEAWAIEVGGHLATINDLAENTWLADFVTAGNKWYSYGAGWIGLEYVGGDRYSPDSWQWTSGEPVTFFNYPADLYYEGTHMYLHGSDHPVSPGKWNCNPIHEIESANYLQPGVIEIPEPATLVLLTLGGLVLRKHRR